MSLDVKNTSNTETGNQKLGNVTVFAGNLVQNSSTHDVELVAVTGTYDKYDDRWDDPTYY